MKEDLKNVIITFGLIALVFTQGSLAYQKKINKEYALVIKQQEELQKTKIEDSAKAEQSRLLAQQELLNKQIAQNQLAIENTQNQTNKDQAAKNQANLLAQQQALVLQQKQAADKALAQAKADQLLAQQQAATRALAQATASQSRQSSAS